MCIRDRATAFLNPGNANGACVGDIDNDGDMDVFLPTADQSNRLYISQLSDTGELSYKDISLTSGISHKSGARGCAMGDFDNDGLIDIYVNNGGFQDTLINDVIETLPIFVQFYIAIEPDVNKLFRNNGDLTFSDLTWRARASGYAFGSGVGAGDIDDDGFLDLYIGTGDPDYRSIQPNRMFINDNGQAFKDVTFESRLGHLQKGHGVSFADIDQDGDLDIHAVMGGAYEGSVYQNTLYENPGNWNTNWIGLSLHGSQSNALAIGARIEIVLENGISIHRTVSSGGSFGGNPFQQMIGIGENNKI